MGKAFKIAGLGEVVISSLQAATVLKLNDEELPVVASMLDVSGEKETQVRKIRQIYDLQLVALTKGAGGAGCSRNPTYDEVLQLAKARSQHGDPV